MTSTLTIAAFVPSGDLEASLKHQLPQDHYSLTCCRSAPEFVRLMEHEHENLDCLVLGSSPDLPQLTASLREESLLLPALIIQADDSDPVCYQPAYHSAEVWSTPEDDLGSSITRAICRFLALNPTADKASETTAGRTKRLNQRLQGRLGYLGIYYKRDPYKFYRRLSSGEREAFVKQLEADYRQIILRYFTDDSSLTDHIDHFVNSAFCADMPVSKIVQIHMDLMDQFAKQLKMEGRREEILLDYRLTLIDVIAHLCEMYRRSIPQGS